MSEETICLADVQNNCLELSSDYRVRFENTQRLILVVGASYPSNSCYFEHSNVAARFNKVFECKHYRSSGHKWWTAHAGVEFYFVIPARNVQIVKEKGYSYIPFLIGGEKFHMNVSGGTFDGWTDSARSTVHVCGISATQKRLKLFAENAVLDQQVEIEPHYYDDEKNRFNRLVADAIVRDEIKEGWKVFFDGSETEYTVVSRGRKMLVSDSVMKYRASSKDIDGVRTAQANNLEIKVATEFNKFPKTVV